MRGPSLPSASARAIEEQRTSGIGDCLWARGIDEKAGLPVEHSIKGAPDSPCDEREAMEPGLSEDDPNPSPPACDAASRLGITNMCA